MECISTFAVDFCYRRAIDHIGRAGGGGGGGGGLESGGVSSVYGVDRSKTISRAYYGRRESYLIRNKGRGGRLFNFSDHGVMIKCRLKSNIKRHAREVLS